MIRYLCQFVRAQSILEVMTKRAHWFAIEMVTILFESIVVCACVPFVSFKSVLSCGASLFFTFIVGVFHCYCCAGFCFDWQCVFVHTHFPCKISISISSNSKNRFEYLFILVGIFVCSYLIQSESFIRVTFDLFTLRFSLIFFHSLDIFYQLTSCVSTGTCSMPKRTTETSLN